MVLFSYVLPLKAEVLSIQTVKHEFTSHYISPAHMRPLITVDPQMLCVSIIKQVGWLNTTHLLDRDTDEALLAYTGLKLTASLGLVSLSEVQHALVCDECNVDAVGDSLT